MTILFLIVARGGSKRLPGKNLREIDGLPLIAYKIQAAKQCVYNSWTFLSTDSPEIAEVAAKFGIDVPFLRPAELATDEATTEDVVRHVIAWHEEQGPRLDAIMLLEPSSPFVRPSDYDAACELMLLGQDVQFVCGKVLYLFRWDYLKTRRDLYDDPVGRIDYVMPDEYAVDIDTPRDYYLAKFLAENQLIDLSWATS